MAKRLKSGDILRLPLGCGWGFAYAKYQNILGLGGNDAYPDLLRLFSYRSPTDEVLDLARVQSYLLPPTLWAGRLPTLRHGRWQLVGALPVLPDEQALPDFRWNECSVADRMRVPHPPPPGATLYAPRLGARCETAVANVTHLEYLGAMPSAFIEYRTTLALMLHEGATPTDCLDACDPTFQYELNVLQTRPFPGDLSTHLYGRARQPGDPGYVPLT